MSANIKISYIPEQLRGNIQSEAMRGPNSPLIAALIAPTNDQASTALELAFSVSASDPGPPDLTRAHINIPKHAIGCVIALAVKSHFI
jgi:hypothetical protein